MVALEVGILTDDFSIEYIANNSATTTPVIFKVASAWAALEGSIVLEVLESHIRVADYILVNLASDINRFLLYALLRELDLCSEFPVECLADRR